VPLQRDAMLSAVLQVVSCFIHCMASSQCILVINLVVHLDSYNEAGGHRKQQHS
jgi:hypothetical protein